MGKLNEFSITLNSPQLVYYPGQSIYGYVTVALNQPMEMRGIKLKLKGKGYCHWSESHTEGSGDDQRTVTHYYTGKETIVKQEQIICGDMSNKMMLPADRQVYQFCFTLPNHIPSSFEGRIGFIRYFMKAKIDKPWKFDHKVKRPITINDLIDTNNPMYAQGPGGEVHKDVGCLCCAAGPVDMSSNIDRSCYCPGEAILINASIRNQTTRNMQNMHAKLIQTVTYHASDNTTQHSEEVARVMGPMIPRGEEAQWFNQPFGIPALPPTIINSKVITVHYKLKVQVAIPCARDAVVKMHLTMGTVPYMKTYGQPVQYGTAEDQQQGPPQSNFVGGLAYPPAQPTFLGYPDMAPPAYSAAVGAEGVNIAGDKDKHTYGELSYNPVYTFAQPYQGSYDWASSSSQPVPNAPPPQPQYYPPPETTVPPPQPQYYPAANPTDPLPAKVDC